MAGKRVCNLLPLSCIGRMLKQKTNSICFGGGVYMSMVHVCFRHAKEKQDAPPPPLLLDHISIISNNADTDSRRPNG